MQMGQVREGRGGRGSGSLEQFFDDEHGPAARGVQPDMLRGIEPFPTKELVPYQPGFLSGWVVERYQIDLPTAAHTAQREMEAEMTRMCAAEVPGDTHRNLQVDTDYSGQTFKHVLVPLWLLTYDYGVRHFQVAINGSTGAIQGRYPKSLIQITLAVARRVAANALH